jgi:hypothetical protein
VCWLDNTTLAMSGIGADDEAMIPGVEIYDANSGAVTASFAGPRGQLYCDAGRLCSASPGGMQIWDIRTGDNTGSVPGFMPSHYHAAGHELAAVDGSILTTRQAR